mmetsp:Transcript_83061/g.221942  ORF Transcript_83061/g.221942 Transcript_83061/m.221942 type:complete len:206 (-) Transcript_83061:45-662(-)
MMPPVTAQLFTVSLSMAYAARMELARWGKPPVRVLPIVNPMKDAMTMDPKTTDPTCLPVGTLSLQVSTLVRSPINTMTSDPHTTMTQKHTASIMSAATCCWAVHGKFTGTFIRRAGCDRMHREPTKSDAAAIAVRAENTGARGTRSQKVGAISPRPKNTWSNPIIPAKADEVPRSSKTQLNDHDRTIPSPAPIMHAARHLAPAGI